MLSYTMWPQLPEDFYNENDRRVRAMMQAFYSQCYPITQTRWYEQDLAVRFFSGDQRLTNDIYGVPQSATRKFYNINMIRPIVNSLSGYQRKNRKNIAVVPVTNASQETADDFTKMITWACNNEHILETVSDAFEGSLITGMNLLHFWLDFRNDPVSGNIKCDNLSYNQFMIDPFFKKADLSDCNGIMVRNYVSKPDAASLFPEFIDDIMALPTYNVRDGKFQLLPQNVNLNTMNLLTYDQFYYRDFREQVMVTDLKTGDQVEWYQDEQELKELMDSHPELLKEKRLVPTTRLAVLVQGRVFYDGANELGIDEYPFVPSICYYHPEMSDFPYVVQGVVHGLKDIQYLYNRHRVIQMDVMESMPNAGYIVKENALVNPRDTQKTGQGITLFLKESAQMTDIQQIQSPSINQGYFAITDLLMNDFSKISGMSEENLGSAVDNVAGVLSMLRQGAGLTQHQGVFDNIDRTLKIAGKLMIKVFQNNFTPAKVERIIGRQPTKEFYNKTFGTYDAVVEEGLNTSTQKQMQFAQVIELIQLGVPIPHEYLLEIATLQDKNELLKFMDQAKQQQQQAQQEQMQAQLKEAQARTELAQARAQADLGLYYERTSRVEENRALAVQKLSESNKNDEEALLNKIKILKEIESIDLSHIAQLIGMANSLKANQVIAQKEQPNEELPRPPQENIQAPSGPINMPSAPAVAAGT